jgi:hypothetical protein
MKTKKMFEKFLTNNIDTKGKEIAARHGHIYVGTKPNHKETKCHNMNREVRL